MAKPPVSQPTTSPVVEMGTIEQLRFDDRNANRGTARGMAALETSLQRLGLGRSILLDRDNRVIAGNKTAEKAGETNAAQRLIIVDTDGTDLVAVRRTDLSLDDPAARELAIADNRVGELNLEWDGAVLETLGEVVDLDPYFADWELQNITSTTTGGDDDGQGGGEGSGSGPSSGEDATLTITCPAAMLARLRAVILQALAEADLDRQVSLD